MTFTRDEIDAAYLAWHEVGVAQDWSAYCDFFTDDAVYVEHELGTFVGREAIREWLVPVMEPLVGWEYPEQWRMIDESQARLVHYWLNILPNPDGQARGRRQATPQGEHSDLSDRAKLLATSGASTEPYQFAGVSICTYAGDGKWSRQEDIYNMKECEAMMADWFAAGGQLGSA
jgi:ketosteroid isomerase-like protein